MSQLPPLSLSSQEGTPPTPSQRRAAPRFTAEEKELLTSLVKEHARFLENKQTDIASLAKKKEVWKEVARIYNSHHGVTRRDHFQLKKCWANLKQKWKEEAAKEKRERHRTGKSTLQVIRDWRIWAVLHFARLHVLYSWMNT